MKYITFILALFLVAGCAHVSTTPLQENNEILLGSWNGQLKTPGGSLTIVFRFEKTEDGNFLWFVDSPDQGSSGIPITDIEIENGTVTVNVSSAQLEYKGKINGDEIVGEFKQGPQPLPLTLKKGEYKAPSFNLSEEDKESLLGPWRFELSQPSGTFKGIYRFEVAQNGEVSGFVDSPGMGVFGVPFSSIELEEGILTVKVESSHAEFKGKMSGDEIIGKFKQGSQHRPLTLKKGAFVYNLNLTEEDMEKLLGEWNGQLAIPAGSMTVVFRFEKTENGEFIGLTDLPDQGEKGIPVTEANLNDGKLTLEMKAIDAGFNGQLSEDGLSGEMAMRGVRTPLSLKKGEYKAPVYSLILSKEAVDMLLGKWQGKLETPKRSLSAVFRFEMTENDQFVGFFDLPYERAKGIPITDANLNDGKLTLKLKRMRAEYHGQLSGEELTGEWKQGGESLPLSLTKKNH